MKTYDLVRQQRVPLPCPEVFSFFADPENLEAITPPWLHFRIVSPRPVPMARGTEIDYRLRVHGIPVSWRTRIDEFEPPVRFVDEQISGPYRLWVHEHRFEEAPDGSTIIHDHVTYAVPGGPLVQALLVRRDLKKIFDYRKERIRELLEPASTARVATRTGT